MTNQGVWLVRRRNQDFVLALIAHQEGLTAEEVRRWWFQHWHKSQGTTASANDFIVEWRQVLECPQPDS